MPETAVSRTIERPIDEVWTVLAHFPATSVYNPEVLSSHSVNGMETGLGAKRHCDFDSSGKKWIEEEIVEFDAEAKRYLIELIGGPSKPPIDSVRVEMSAAADGPNQTIVTATAYLQGDGLKERLMAQAGVFAMKPVLRRVLAGLDHHVRTGDVVEDRAFLEQAGIEI